MQVIKKDHSVTTYIQIESGHWVGQVKMHRAGMRWVQKVSFRTTKIEAFEWPFWQMVKLKVYTNKKGMRLCI